MWTALLLYSQLFSTKREWIRRINQRTQRTIRHGEKASSRLIPSFAYRIRHTRQTWKGHSESHLIESQNIDFTKNLSMKVLKFIWLIDKEKWVTHPIRCPFSISSLTMTYFLSIGQEKSFALAHLTSNFLTREIYFPGNGKGQCILRKPCKVGHSLNNPCRPPSSL